MRSGVNNSGSGVYAGVIKLELLFTGDSDNCVVVFPKVCVV